MVAIFNVLPAGPWLGDNIIAAAATATITTTRATSPTNTFFLRASDMFLTKVLGVDIRLGLQNNKYWCQSKRYRSVIFGFERFNHKIRLQSLLGIASRLERKQSSEYSNGTLSHLLSVSKGLAC